MRVLKLNNFHVIFSINKAEKCYSLFSEQRKYVLVFTNLFKNEAEIVEIMQRNHARFI